jgi:hypothetical protein
MKKALWLAILALAAAGALQAGNLKLTAPVGGELCMGAAVKIEWTAAGIGGKLKLRLMQAGGALAGVIARDLDPAAGHYNWTAGAPAAAGQTYKISLITADGSTASASGLILFKDCGNNNPPPPPPPPPSNLPRMKSQMEIMQQPPQLAPQTPVAKPNTVLATQLPQAKVDLFNPDRKTFFLGDKVTINFSAQNVSQAEIVDEAAGASYDQSPFISHGILKRTWVVTPTQSGTWRLKVNNAISKAEAHFDLVQQFPKPVVVKFVSSSTRFTGGEKVIFSALVQNADKIVLCNDTTGTDVNTFYATPGAVDSYTQFGYAPGHTCKMVLRAENNAGKVYSDIIHMENINEVPLLYEFDPYRNSILHIPTDSATIRYRLRGVKTVSISWRDPGYPDIPANYNLIKSFSTDGMQMEGKFEYKPNRFPVVFRMNVECWDGFQTIITRTVQ